MENYLISISVVSHGQANMLVDLLNDFHEHCAEINLELIVTINIPEVITFDVNNYSYPIKVLENKSARGFGYNHNQAFSHASGKYFCVMNPDIRLMVNPFDDLLSDLDDLSIGVVSPKIYDNSKVVMDSARKMLTPMRLIERIYSRGTIDYEVGDNLVFPDWLAGMFMIFRKEVYEEVLGFDTKFFLYCEDVAICINLQKYGYKVVLDPRTYVVHNARRDSHKKLKYMYWHVKSLIRLFIVYLPMFYKINKE